MVKKSQKSSKEEKKTITCETPQESTAKSDDQLYLDLKSELVNVRDADEYHEVLDKYPEQIKHRAIFDIMVDGVTDYEGYRAVRSLIKKYDMGFVFNDMFDYSMSKLSKAFGEDLFEDLPDELDGFKMTAGLVSGRIGDVMQAIMVPALICTVHVMMHNNIISHQLFEAFMGNIKHTIKKAVREGKSNFDLDSWEPSKKKKDDDETNWN